MSEEKGIGKNFLTQQVLENSSGAAIEQAEEMMAAVLSDKKPVSDLTVADFAKLTPEQQLNNPEGK